MKDLKSLTSTDLDHRGQLTHEPRWLRMQRVQAWEDFQSLPELNWKKSKTPQVDPLQSTQIDFPESDIPVLKVEKKPPQGASGKITFHNGKVLRLSLEPELAYQGVIFCDMQTAVLERADLLEGYIKESHWGVRDKLSSFGRAFWENGYFLFVPKGVQIEKPFQVQVIQTKPQESVLFRNIIILDEKAEAIVEEGYESSGTAEEEIFCSTTTEAFTEEAAKLKYFSNQNWGSHVYDNAYRRLHAAEQSQIFALFCILGAKAGRTVITGDASEKAAHIEHDAIIVGRDQQNFKIIAEIDHDAQETEGMMRYKGILKDKAYSDLAGLIRIRPTAQHSQSRLEEHTILLSEKARCDTLPALDIQTDKVQVSHAAAVTQADVEKIFYLQSRGLSEEEARGLIVQGFFEDLLAKISQQSWYESTKALIESKLLS